MSAQRPVQVSLRGAVGESGEVLPLKVPALESCLGNITMEQATMNFIIETNPA